MYIYIQPYLKSSFARLLVLICIATNLSNANAQLLINEFLASNNSGIQDPEGENADWIEIYNAGAGAVDLGGLYITDNLSDLTKHQIPLGFSAQTTIQPGGYLLFWADGDVGDGPLHLGFALGANGEEIGLVDSDGSTILDSIVFGPQDTDVSYGRNVDGGAVFHFFTAPTPNAANFGGQLAKVADTKFDHDRGFYTAPFMLAITSDTPGANIRYTTDGSLPSETSGTLYTGPISISQTTNVRAMAYSTGLLSTNVDTHTYIFTDDVLTQTGAGFPDTWGWAGADYEMDPNIVFSPTYQDRMTSSLLALPSVSLALPVDDMFAAGGVGIYPIGEGIPKATSVELIDPSGEIENFQSNCSVEVFGGTSVDRWKTDKLQFRLRFKPPYGPTKLVAKIFGDFSTAEFDNLVLNSRLANTWTYNGTVSPDTQRARAQYVRDQYAANLQNKISGLGAPHGNHVHLYINGLYWGIYGFHERPDESFAEAYYGGNKDNYDVIKHRWDLAVNGTVANYQAMVLQARAGLSTFQQYLDFQQQLDINPFIEYILTYFYIGVVNDWARSNWYATRDVSNPDAKWHFQVWDAEHCLEGINDNGTGLGTQADNQGAPTEVHERLTANAEYRLRFADHVHRLFFNNGTLTPQGAQAAFMELLNRVDPAIPAESARWGDNVYPNNPYTRDNHWIAERTRLLNTWFPNRTNVMLGFIRNRGLYPDVEAPVFNINAVYQHGGTISSGDLLTMDNPNGGGTIYYTLDGSDPRELPGAADSTALVADDAEIHVLVPTSASDGAGTVSGGSLLIDFSNLSSPVQSGYAAYRAEHENPATFTSQNYSAFNTTVTVTPSWAPGAVAAAMQMIERGAQSYEDATENLMRDWIGTDTRSAGDPLTLTISGLPAGSYTWTSYHHDTNASIMGLFDVTVNDANGAAVTTNIQITGNAVTTFDGVAKFITTIISNGVDDITLVFDQQPYTFQFNQAWFVMNGFALVQPPDDWKSAPDYDDATWAMGNVGVGYETVSGYDPYFDVDVESEMYNVNSSCYVRIPFTVTGTVLDDMTQLILSVRYDDGFIAYLNGTQVASANAPASPSWNSNATGSHDDASAILLEPFDITLYKSALIDGNNVLAIHGLNVNNTDDDFLIDAELTAIGGNPVGEPSSTAAAYSGAITLNDAVQVKSRVVQNDEWSALNAAVYVLDTMSLRDSLRITEVMYNPAQPPAGSPYSNEDFEFIELKNTGSQILEVAGVRFTAGVSINLGMIGELAGTLFLAADECAVVVKNRDAFESRYGAGIRILGEYDGSLSNEGERLQLIDPSAAVLLEIEYDDSRGWPQAPAGAGHSLVPQPEYLDTATSGSLDYPGNWRASAWIGGSPGADDPPPAPSVLLNEFAAHTDYSPSPPDSNDWIELYNPTPADMVLNDCYLSDDIEVLTKWAIPNGTLLRSGESLSFDEITDFHNPAGFGLNKDGERVVLSWLPTTGTMRVLDEVRFKGQENGVSLGRYPDGDVSASGPGLTAWQAMPLTRDAANAAPNIEPVINQILYHTAGGNEDYEYLELFNPTTQTVQLFNADGNWRLNGGIELEITGNRSIPAGGYLLAVDFDPTSATQLAAFMAEHGVSTITASDIIGPSSGSLSNRVDRIALERPQAPDVIGGEISWVIVDEVIYFDQAPFPAAADGTGQALHRVSSSEPGMEPTNWVANDPYLDKTQIITPVVTNHPATNITATGATLNGELLMTGGENPTVSIFWGTTDGGTVTGNWANQESIGVTGPAVFNAAISSLTASTTYYYRAYAINSAGAAWAEETSSFIAVDPAVISAPTLSLLPASAITYNSAVLNATVDTTGGEDPLVTFYFGLTDEGSVAGNWDDSQSAGINGVGSVSAQLTNLTASTTYFYTVAGTNSAGTAWTSTGSFTTSAVPSVLPPVVAVQLADNITTQSATLNGVITDTGGENPTVTFYWGEIAGGTNPSNWSDSAVIGVFGMGPLSHNITGLNPDTTYYFQVFAENSGGSDWSNATGVFTTESEAPGTFNPPEITDDNVTNVSHILATVQFTVNSTGGQLPEVRIYWGTQDGGLTGSNWDNVLSLGVLDVGFYSADIAPLNYSTEYHYRIYAENTAGAVWTADNTFITAQLPGGSPNPIGSSGAAAASWWWLHY